MNPYLKYMDRKTLSQELQDAVWNNPESALGINFGHTKDLHVGKSDSELVLQMCDAGKSAASCFIDQNIMVESLSHAILYCADKIADWVQTDRKEFKNPADYRKFIFSLNIDGDPIGYGFKQDLKKYETPCIRVVLERDMSDIDPYGFLLTTAYADITDPEAKATGIQFTKEQVKEENLIDFRSCEQETAFYLSGDYPGLRIAVTKDRMGCNQLTFKKNLPERQLTAHLNQGRVAAFVREGFTNQKISSSELPKEMQDALYQAKRILHEIAPYGKSLSLGSSQREEPQTVERVQNEWER